MRDYLFSRPNPPSPCWLSAPQSDWEVCSRFWAAGFYVGYMPMAGKELDEEQSGAHKPDTQHKCFVRQRRLASDVYKKRYGDPRFQASDEVLITSEVVHSIIFYHP